MDLIFSEESVKHWDKANLISPDADAFYWKGRALIKLSKDAEAQDAFRAALQITPTHQLAQKSYRGARP